MTLSKLKLLSFLLLIAAVCSSCSSPSQNRIVVGWLTTWAPVGQIFESLTHTNIPALCHSNLEFRGFIFGPDANEAAFSGHLDSTNNGLIPTISLLSAAGKDWIVIGKLSSSPLAIIARKGSGIKTIKDLEGKVVAVPFGSGPHPYLLLRFKEAGLSYGDRVHDVHLLNMQVTEQPIALAQASADAIATWDPQTTLAITKGFGYQIDKINQFAVITIRRSVAERDPQAVVNLLKAFIQARYYAVHHVQQVNCWFANTSGMQPELLEKIKCDDPNLSASNINDIHLELTKDDLLLAQKFANVMSENNLLQHPIQFSSYVDQSYLDKAVSSVKQDSFFNKLVQAQK